MKKWKIMEDTDSEKELREAFHVFEKDQLDSSLLKNL